jgi:glutaredoxin
MCGVTIHMLPKLIEVIKARGPKIDRFTLNSKDKIFMYARKNCSFSRKAWRLLKSHVKADNFTIVDGKNNHYLCSKTFEVKPELDNDVLKDLLKLWEALKNEGSTYPDIYIHKHPEWYHVGGCDSLQAAVTLPDIDLGDLLHLLPLGRYNTGSEVRTLKF